MTNCNFDKKITIFTFKYPPAIYGSGILAKFLKKELEGKFKLDIYSTQSLLIENHYNNLETKNKALRATNEESVIYLETIKNKKHLLYRGLRLIFKGLDKLFKFQLVELLEMGPLVFDKRYFSLFFSPKPSSIIILPLGNFFNLSVYLYSFIRRIPFSLIPCFHPGADDFELKFNWFLLKRAQKIFVLSNIEKKYFIKRGIEAKKIFLWFVKLNPENYQKKSRLPKLTLPKTHKAIIFLCLGRMDKYKRIGKIIKAFNKALKETENIFLIIAGQETTYSKKIISMLKNNLPKNKYFYLGRVSDSERNYLLSKSDVVVNLSQFESLSIVVLEAWAMKKMVVVSHNKVFKERVKNSKNGLICKNLSNDLYRKIIWLSQNREKIKNMGEAGYKSLSEEIETPIQDLI